MKTLLKLIAVALAAALAGCVSYDHKTDETHFNPETGQGETTHHDVKIP